MQKMITILGPTATGKTPLAVAVARALPTVDGSVGGEIISADSRQVYRRMDIGTGKDLDEYTVSDAGTTVTVPYHLIDIVEPGTKYNLFQYQQDFQRAYNNIVGRGLTPILCGGTGLYIEAVLKGYQLSPVPQNPELRSRLEGKSLDELTQMLAQLKARNGSAMHNTTDVDSCQRAIRAIEIETAILESRQQAGAAGSGAGVAAQPAADAASPYPRTCVPPIPSLIVGVSIDREERRRKITNRLRQRLDNGMIDEVRGLLAEGIPAADILYYGLEYKFVTEYVLGRLSYDEMFSRLEIAIHQFAKRQMTWFRGMERRGFSIRWIDAMLPMEEKVRQIIAMLGE